MKLKRMIAFILLFCLCLPTSVTMADSPSPSVSFSKSSVILDTRTNQFTVDIKVSSSQPFSSAEFGLRPEGALRIVSVSYPEAFKGASKAGPKEKNGVSYFGLFSSRNQYQGNLTICTVTFEYTGTAPAAVTLAEASLTAVTGNGGAVAERMQAGSRLDVSRKESGSDTGNPGNGGTDTGNPNTPSDGQVSRVTVPIDNDMLAEAIEHSVKDRNGVRNIVIDLREKAGQSGSLKIELPDGLLRVDEERRVRIELPFASFTIPSKVLQENEWLASQSLSLLVARLDPYELPAPARQLFGNRPILDLQFALDDELVVWNNPERPVIISIPYTPTAEESGQPHRIVVFYSGSNGQLQVVPSGRYDAAAGRVVFTATHFSAYGIAFERKAFSDITASWAKTEIEALAVRGIIQGVSTDRFAPQRSITRADFTKLLVGILDKKAASAEPFDDVSPGDYYYDAVMTARSLGIVNGVNKLSFAPGNSISRQEVMVMLDRAFTKLGQELQQQDDLSSFNDQDRIAAYASSSVSKLVAAGIIQGNQGKLRPNEPLTRAEAARVLYLFYNMVM